jgi:hypothetical protein
MLIVLHINNFQKTKVDILLFLKHTIVRYLMVEEEFSVELLKTLISQEVASMEKKYGGADESGKGSTQTYLYTEGFQHKDSDDHLTQGAPILAYAFLGFGITHNPKGDIGTERASTLIVYADLLSVYPFIQHSIAKRQQSSDASYIGVSIYDNVPGPDAGNPKAERKGRISAVFWGSMIFKLSSSGKCFIIFPGIRSYSTGQVIKDDTDQSGTLAWKVISINCKGDQQLLTSAAK